MISQENPSRISLIRLLIGAILLQQIGILVVQRHIHLIGSQHSHSHSHISALSHEHELTEQEHTHFRWLGFQFHRPQQQHTHTSKETSSTLPSSATNIDEHSMILSRAAGQNSSTSIVNLKLTCNLPEDFVNPMVHNAFSLRLQITYRGRLRDRPLLPPPKV